MTPVKKPISSSFSSSRSLVSENFNPNISTSSSPVLKSKKSPLVDSKKSTPRSLNRVISPRKKIQERKFVVAKKNPKKGSSVSTTVTCKCKDKIEGNKKCPCIAYQTLRASQEDFFKNRRNNQSESEEFKSSVIAQIEEEEEKKLMGFIDGGDYEAEYGLEGKALETLENYGSSTPPIIQDSEEIDVKNGMGSSKIKRRREKLLEEARSSVPEPGSGRVMHLVNAFERLLSIPKCTELKEDEEGEEKEEEDEENEEKKKKGLRWALPGLQPAPRVLDRETTSSSFSQSEMFFNSGNFEIGSSVSSSLDSSHGSFTSRTSGGGGGRRSRRNSSDSSGTSDVRRLKKKKQLKVTSQKPFKLRTEQRGRLKEEEFVKKVQEMLTGEEKMRIPIAQGLPWTTDEPELLVKPPVKEITRPLDLKLHSDVRAVDRSEFDHQVAEKLSLIEQYKLERERQQRLEEEEEIKRLRKELVPRAQPMPYFDRPFIPKRSEKHPTIPKEPKFHIPHHKIRCMSWDQMNTFTHHH